MTPQQLADLKAELTADPLGKQYSNMGDEAAAESLNARTRMPNRETIDGGLLVSCVVRAEYDLLTAEDRRYLEFVVSGGSVPNTQSVREGLRAVFGNNTASRANIIAALKRSGSRAEELGLPSVTPSDVAKAKRL